MESGGTIPAGAGRVMRPDPYALPVRFPARDAAADGQIRQVEIDRDRVILRRAVRGIRMKVGLPVAAFRGVNLTVGTGPGEEPLIAVTLDHRDAALCVPLLVTSDGSEVLAVWKSWARVLRLPLLFTEGDGVASEPFGRLGVLATSASSARRRRRCAIKRRRPSIFLRRRAGRSLEGAAIHRDEREIIARN